MIEPPKRKTKYLPLVQVEEHEIGILWEVIECSACHGTGIESTEFEGNEYEQDCENCLGCGYFAVSIDKKKDGF